MDYAINFPDIKGSKEADITFEREFEKRRNLEKKNANTKGAPIQGRSAFCVYPHIFTLISKIRATIAAVQRE